MSAAAATTDTIAAVATAPGAGGVGIVRLSGPQALAIAAAMGAGQLRPRRARYARFLDGDGEVIDDGIALAFLAPASFTGEDVVELQAHGSPVVLRALVARACALGARPARPGEFSERAFLNGKLDLAQAEAIADLIAAGDARAARAARRSLEGVFSRRIQALSEQLLRLRVHVEAAIDFADEPLDTLGGAAVRSGLAELGDALAGLLAEAERGRRLRDGLHVVIVGPPNAGKSSLLNALAGRERAIVSALAGTTRDTLHEVIRVDGLELTLVDTAGLRSGGDAIEREGMRRAGEELQRADVALVVVDARDPQAGHAALADLLDPQLRQLWLHNKTDLLPATHALPDQALGISTRTGAGIQALLARLQALVSGPALASAEGEFSARARHVLALEQALAHLDLAKREIDHETLELAAEHLRLAHDALGEITGKTSPDALLGRIFSTFCIGK
ncbi:tRNA uridine-5-carboxymethylaminomethyl(34) synthesis GTPase MnmE [Pseudoxanthomonas spadix]|uniref:tRNA uridine-5-carboxymethylaminomethyl(34) synthesis GTPase MnmE n=1 Tax=Pseudoxanthomonas spadix TaxID=415229 RepID=UPI000EFDC5E4|nr:tRNA uridine-5-carboxymethylaminomethyl(34) synthesis GTPase MnmE [Pseudoxanthomonas spadix]MBP3974719.1 tRNA uridine-5-carboxymethylaminomethyl(34) synthesis GTPase MnmE [Pseudoxanthomonas spadix]RMW92894.1 tRNA uridine-5-carboxymethylaminomethyl(34) synthesis GTPase MnmE [Pseudoxanthomonas spadix]